MGIFKPVFIDKFSLDPPKNCPASKMTWYCGADGEDMYFMDRKWRHSIFKKYPKRYSIQLAKFYIEAYAKTGRVAANRCLREYDQTLSNIDFKLASNEDALKKYAEEIAYKCRRASLNPDNLINRLRLLERVAKQEKVKLPFRKGVKSIESNSIDHKSNSIESKGNSIGNKNDKKTAIYNKGKEKIAKHGKEIESKAFENEKGIVNRLSDPIWWRRNLRKIHRQGLEKSAIHLNLVNKRKCIYISDDSFNCAQKQSKRNAELLATMIAINELGEEFTLEQLSKLSNSNPLIRRAELMVRIAGSEKLFYEQGYIAVFYTITCPSRMHSAMSKSGKRNPKYDKTTPKAAQEYLNSNWKKIRSKLNRDEIDISGVRVAEPHHDGTPHWHLLVFMKPHNKEIVTDTFRKYALMDSPNEKGAKTRRITHELINKRKGSATGYIAKYISKNIDGTGLEVDEFGNAADSAANRVKAWASTWGIRQFQFFGIPPISQWRELRRITPGTLPSGLVNECAKAADDSDWYQYMKLMGGASTKKMDYPIKLLRIWSDELGKYGEAKGFITKGIEHNNISYITRMHTWTIESKKHLIESEKQHVLGKVGGSVERLLPGSAWQGPPILIEQNKSLLPKYFHPLEYCQ